MNRRLHALVSGRVQGVSFRAFTRQEALRLRLTGWVRNLNVGQVEFAAEGEMALLQALLLAVKRGPPASQVQAVTEDWAESTGEFAGFVIAADGR